MVIEAGEAADVAPIDVEVTLVGLEGSRFELSPRGLFVFVIAAAASMEGLSCADTESVAVDSDEISVREVRLVADWDVGILADWVGPTTAVPVPLAECKYSVSRYWLKFISLLVFGMVTSEVEGRPRGLIIGGDKAMEVAP